MSIEYDRVFQTKRLKIYEVAEDVFASVVPNHGWGWVNNAFITRGKGLVFDSFFDLKHCREMLSIFKEVSGKERPTYLVNSHANGDHVFGNQLFKDSVIIAHKNLPEGMLQEPLSMYKDIKKYGGTPQGNPMLDFYAKEFANQDFRGLEWVEPDILIDSDITLYLEGMEVQILNVAPGHSESDLIIWLPEEKVVFASDIVFSGGGIVAHSGKGAKNWEKALDKIIALDPKVVIPGHGSICDVDEVKKLKKYFVDVRTQFEEYYDPDLEPIEIAKKIDVTEYINWLQPERVMSIVIALGKEKRNEVSPPDFGYLVDNMVRLKEFHEEKYKDIIKPWNPMVTWEL